MYICAVIRVSGLTYSYNRNQVLNFPDFECANEEAMLLLGQSGCGKTTLLHLIGGLLKPHTGQVMIGDTDITKLSHAALDQFRGKNIGIVFQASYFIKSLTVKENLLVAQTMSGGRKDIDRITTLLERMNLRHKLNESTYALSQGEQQRVAIARALVNKPKLILADEPPQPWMMSMLTK